MERNQNGGKKWSSNRTGILLICCVALLCAVSLLYIRVSIGRAAPPDESPSPSATAPATTDPVQTPSPAVSESLDPEESPSEINTEPVEPSQDEPYEWEQNNGMTEPDAAYANIGYYSYNYDPYGAFICVGVKTDEETDMVYLNPQASVTGFPDSRIAFYLTPSRGDLVYSTESYSGKNDGKNAGRKFFVTDWVYDELMPVEYIDSEDYGVGWCNNYLYDGKMHEGADIYIRAVDLSHRNRLLATAKATIIFDEQTKTYRLSGIQSTDVSATGELTAEERAELVSRAYDYASDLRYGPSASIANSLQVVGTKEEAVAKATVEFLGNKTYFPKLFNTSEQLMLSSIYTNRFDDIFAVSIPVKEKGFITMYYSAEAPQLSYLGKDLDRANEGDMEGLPDLTPATSLELNYFGIDFYNPETRSD